jgi:hypothetical protein
MTIEELKRHIQQADWFVKLGKFQEREGMLALGTLEAWRSADAAADEHHRYIADNMRWLPSESSEADPIHGGSLKLLAEETGKAAELKTLSLDIYKLTLVSLRPVVASPLLRVGSHDFNPVARNSVAYTTRMAASEICVDRQGFWCSLVPLFSEGFFPCGLMPDGKLVVY